MCPSKSRDMEKIRYGDSYTHVTLEPPSSNRCTQITYPKVLFQHVWPVGNMPRAAIDDWLSHLKTKADERGIPLKIELEDPIFHFELGTDDPVLGKVRTSVATKRNYTNDPGESHIWQRFSREQEHLKKDPGQRVCSIQLDLQESDGYDEKRDHFLFIPGELILQETYSKGDQKIYITGKGQYRGELARYTDDWDALFDYVTGDLSLDGIDENQVEAKLNTLEEESPSPNEDSGSWYPNSESEYRAKWLVDRYKSDRSWNEIRRSADCTSRAVRKTLESIVREYERIDTEALTALFRICQNDNQIKQDTKRDGIEDLPIQESEKEEIIEEIAKGTGSVGGPNFSLSVPDEETGEALLEILEELVETEDSNELDKAVKELADLDIKGLQAGSISPILHYLHPNQFPILNGLVEGGVQKYFGPSFSTALDEYLHYRDEYRQIRDNYGFNQHFRDIDYFFVWADNKSGQWNHNWTWMLDGHGNDLRNIFQIQPGSSGSEGGFDERESLWSAWTEHDFISVGGEDGDLRKLTGEELRQKGDKHDWGATRAWEMFMEMVPGDIIIAKWGTNDLIGIGVVEPESYEYKPDGPGYQEIEGGGSTAHPHIRSVDWILTDDSGWSVNQLQLSTNFIRATASFYNIFEELRYKSAPIFSNGIEVFRRLEEVSRGDYGEPEVDFTGYSDKRGDVDILGTEKETSRPQIEKGDLLDGLYYSDEDALVNRISAAIRSGKYIVFTGPPGTGKTELAENVGKLLVNQDQLQFSGYKLTTATADWTTFETIGGRMPSDEGDNLIFSPGFFLERFKQDHEQRNDILIIDELNRADIDKAFGQLFTVLSGQAVQLPFKRDNKSIEIIPEDEWVGTSPEIHQFIVPENWRLIATMNSYDKASLYEMSYAFMRRLAFIEVGIPNLEELNATEEPIAFMAPYIAEWYNTDSSNIDAEIIEADKNLPKTDDIGAVVTVWQSLATGEHTRPVGPALVKDMIEYMDVHKGTLSERLADAVVAYVYPQLEGVPNRKEIVDELSNLDALSGMSDQVRKTAETMLDFSFDGASDDSIFDQD